MSKEKFIKLGENAQSFSDPTTGVSVKRNTVLKLTPVLAKSKKIIAALRGGHLQYAEQTELDDYEASRISTKADNAKATANEGDGIMDREFLEVKNNDTLRTIAKNTLTDDDDVTESDIKKMKKDELVDFILREGDYAPEEEEDEDDEEDDQ